MRSSKWSRSSKSRTKRAEAVAVACINGETTAATEADEACAVVDEAVEEGVVVEEHERETSTSNTTSVRARHFKALSDTLGKDMRFGAVALGSTRIRQSA
jgi:hypothetical protein